MGKKAKKEVVDIVDSALKELSEEKKVKKAKKSKKIEAVLIPVAENLRYNGFEKDQIIEIPIVDNADGLADIFQIESIGVEEGRYYANLNRLKVSGEIDKRYKPLKKFFDEGEFRKVNVFNKGDKVYLHKRGRIAWEMNDYSRAFKKNYFYTVRQTRFDKKFIYVETEECGTLLHPNHFVKKEDNE